MGSDFGSQLLLAAIITAALGLLSLVVGESLPRRWFRFDRFPYRAWKWEKQGKIYERLAIRKWKDRVPDNSKLFPWLFKKKMTSFHDPAYSLRLLQETCEAEAVHWALAFSSFVYPLLMEPVWGRVMCVVYIVGQMPFIMIQRYNRPRLAALYERQLRHAREQKERAMA